MLGKKTLPFALIAALLVTPVMQVNAEQFAVEAVGTEQVEKQVLQVENVKQMSVEQSQQMVEQQAQDNDEGLESAWQAMEPMPTPRHGFGTAVVDGKVYIIGGAKQELTNAVGVVEVYDPKTNSWTTAAPMNSPRKAFATVAYNEEIYTIGGGKGNAVKKVEIYNPETNTWRNGTPIPEESYNGKAVVLNDKIYVLHTHRTKFFYEYDPQSDVWTKKQSTDAAIGRVGLTVFDGDIYAVGGLTPGKYVHGKLIPPVYHQTVQRYNIVNDEWEEVPEMSMLTGRYEAETVEVDGRLFLADTRSPEHSAELYDPEQQYWFNLESMPGAASQNGLIVDHTDIVAVDGQVYVMNKQFSQRYSFQYKLPAAPRNFEKVLGANDIELTWHPVLDAVTYDVYRSYSPEGPFTSIAENVYGTTYQYDIPAEDLYTPLYYVVSAKNSYGQGDYSNTIDSTPNAPIKVEVDPGGNMTYLTWDSIDKGEDLSYTVYTYDGDKWVEVGSSIKENYFVHEGLVNDRNYYYKVKAVNNSGLSPDSKQVGVKTLGWKFLPGPRIPLTVEQVDGEIKLSWEYEDDNATYYSLRRTSRSGENIAFPITTETSLIDENETVSGEMYHYFLVGYDENNNFKLDGNVFSIIAE
ncbi:Kelch repeat-containing protein [Longirhabdus pacifica]|uniref:Kelch repeat-containing protein n=1 Tax=Longirhabdus pacifica TaxID=2305227 RepID=UPI0013E89F95|nr:kelch repeat-containing protein [Longirhabdus pacifica]